MGGGVWVEICEIKHFLYFRRLYMSWCGCLCCLWVLTCSYAFGEYWSLDISTIFTIWIVFYQIEKNKKSLHYSYKDSNSSSFYWHVITCLNDSRLDNTRKLKALFSTEIIEKKKKKKLTKAIWDWFHYNHYQINNLVASHQSSKLIKKNLELQRKIKYYFL